MDYKSPQGQTQFRDLFPELTTEELKSLKKEIQTFLETNLYKQFESDWKQYNRTHQSHASMIPQDFGQLILREHAIASQGVSLRVGEWFKDTLDDINTTIQYRIQQNETVQTTSTKRRGAP